MLKNILFFLFFFIGFIFTSQAQKLEISYFVDSLHHHTIEEINKVKFIESQNNVLNFSNTSSAIWVRIKVPISAKNKILEIANPLIDTLDIYHSRENTFVKKRYGSHLPFDQRAYNNRMFLFDINESELIYIRLSSKFPLEIPIYLTDQKQIDKKQTSSNFFFGLYFGILFALFMYNFFLAFNVKDKAYIYYLGYIICVGLLYAMLTGFAQIFLYPNKPSLNSYLVFILGLAVFFIIKFSSQYLKLKENSIKNYWVLKIIASLSLIMAIFDLFIDSVILIALSQVVSLVISLYLIVVGFYLLIFKKQKQALIYGIAWIGYLTGIALLMLQINGVVPSNFITQNFIFIGSAAEVILFSIALAMRINQYRKEKEEAQKSELQQGYEKVILEQKLLRTQMEPHFIFNTLSTLQSLIRFQEPQKAIDYLNLFSRLLRSNLELSRKEMISLEDEVETIHNYLSLQQARFKDYFTYQIQVPHELEVDALFIPPMLIQPFVENSILHGFDGEREWNIEIKITELVATKQLQIEIIDNGVGIHTTPKKKHKSLSGEIAKERLEILSKKYKIPTDYQIFSEQGKGTTVCLKLPIIDGFQQN
ncbi:7TM diverse intracellular signaling domain-containing protein [Bernardetia sp. MNP-M8]|uniref:7TM diverse intracellular signaling domain-containing protein n=1 Tax=Bernardetia sp. MNP-M8 TaxID=3127470 RepID=UPI0030CFBFA8